MTSPIDTMVVDVVPSQTFERELLKIIDSAMRKAQQSVDAAAGQIDRTLGTAASHAGTSFSQLGSSASRSLNDVSRIASSAGAAVGNDIARGSSEATRSLTGVSQSAQTALERTSREAGDAAETLSREFDDATDSVKDDFDGIGRKAKDEFDETAKHAKASSTVMSDVFSKATRAIVAAFATIQIVGFFVDATKAAVQFDTGIREVISLFGATPPPGLFKTLEDGVNQLGREFGTLTTAAVPALYEAISSGVPPDTVFDFLATANKAAIGGVTDLATAVDGITSVINAYGPSVLSAAEASDIMFVSVKLGKTTFDELSRSLFNVAPIAASMGVAFSDVGAAIAALTASGPPTSVATTEIPKALAEQGKEGTKASDIFRQLSGKTFQEFIAGGGNLQQALQILETAAQGSNESILNMFTSIEAGQGALALTGPGTALFSQALDEMAKSAGATDAAFNTLAGGVGFTLKQLQADFEQLKLGIGAAIAPLVKVLAEALLPILDQLKPVIAQIAESFANAFAPVAHALQPVFVLLADLAKTVLPPLATIIGAVANALAPVIQILADLGSKILVALAPHLDLLADVLNQIAVVIGSSLEQALPPLADAFLKILDAVLPLIPTILSLIPPALQVVTALLPLVTIAAQLSAAVITLLAPLIQLVAKLVELLLADGVAPLITLIAEALTAVLTPLQPVIDALNEFNKITVSGDDWKNFGADISDGFDEALDSVGEFFAGIGDFFASIPGKIAEFVESLPQRLADAANQAIDALIEVLAFGIALIIVAVTDLPRQIGLALIALAGIIADAFTNAWQAAVDITKELIQEVHDFIQERIDAIIFFFTHLDELPGKTREAFEKVTAAVKEKIEQAIEFVKGLPGRVKDAIGDAAQILFDSGGRIIQGLIDGIKSKFNKLTDAIGEAVKKIRDHLPFSPAKEGPLSGEGDPELAGAKITTMVASGITGQLERMRLAAASLAETVTIGVSPAAVAAGGGAGGGGLTTTAGAAGGVGTVTQQPVIAVFIGNEQIEAFIDRRVDERLRVTARELANGSRGV